MKFYIHIHKADVGGYWAEVPALPGCVSEGETEEELVANIKEAIQGWFEAKEALIEVPPNCDVITISI
jgi:predicted RNase H-like HicB family nuclease